MKKLISTTIINATFIFTAVFASAFFLNASCAQKQVTLAPTAEAQQPTENLRTPAASEVEKSQIETGQRKVEETQTPTASDTSIAPPPQAQGTVKPAANKDQPKITERARAILKGPPDVVHGETVLEQNAKGTWVHVRAEGLQPKANYNLSLYDKTECGLSQQSRAPKSQPQKSLGRVATNDKGSARFSQFFEGLKINGENGVREKAILLTQADISAQAANTKTARADMACSVLNN